jgi:hypothetical protein
MDISSISAANPSENVMQTRDRSRSTEDLTEAITQPPHKKQKREHSRPESPEERLARPEFIGTDPPRSPTPQTHAEPQTQRSQEFFEVAKQGNSANLFSFLFRSHANLYFTCHSYSSARLIDQYVRLTRASSLNNSFLIHRQDALGVGNDQMGVYSATLSTCE